MSFINTGADEALLKSLYGDSVHVDQDELCKAMNRAGLVQKDVQVRGKNGQTFTRKQWVRASDAQSTQFSSSSQKKTDTNDKKTSDIQFDDFMLTWKDSRGGHVEHCKTVEELKDKLKYYGLPESLADFSPKNINKKSIQERGYTENSYKRYSVCAYPTDDFLNDTDSKSSKETSTDIPDDLKDKLKHPDDPSTPFKSQYKGFDITRFYSGKIEISKNGEKVLSTYSKPQAAEYLVNNSKNASSDTNDKDNSQTQDSGQSSKREVLMKQLKNKYGNKVTLGSVTRSPKLDKGNMQAYMVKGYYKNKLGEVRHFYEPAYIDTYVYPARDSSADNKNTQSKTSTQKKSDTDDKKSIKPSLSDIKKYGYDSSTATGDPTLLKIGDKSYYKIKENKWQYSPNQGSALGGTYTDEQINDMVSKSNEDIVVYPSSKKNSAASQSDTGNTSSGSKLSPADAKAKTKEVTKNVTDRNAFMEKAKAQGITWKENDHAGINWMRCCMALNKHFENGGSFDNSENNALSNKKETSKENNSFSEKLSSAAKSGGKHDVDDAIEDAPIGTAIDVNYSVTDNDGSKINHKIRVTKTGKSEWKEQGTNGDGIRNNTEVSYLIKDSRKSWKVVEDNKPTSSKQTKDASSASAKSVGYSKKTDKVLNDFNKSKQQFDSLDKFAESDMLKQAKKLYSRLEEIDSDAESSAGSDDDIKAYKKEFSAVKKELNSVRKTYKELCDKLPGANWSKLPSGSSERSKAVDEYDASKKLRNKVEKVLYPQSSGISYLSNGV